MHGYFQLPAWIYGLDRSGRKKQHAAAPILLQAKELRSKALEKSHWEQRGEGLFENSGDAACGPFYCVRCILTKAAHCAGRVVYTLRHAVSVPMRPVRQHVTNNWN